MKKLLALVVTFAQVAILAPMTMAASETTVVYDYKYSDFTTADEVKAYGVSINSTNSWSTPKNTETVAKTTGIWWIAASRAADSAKTEKLLSTVNFAAKDTDKLLENATSDKIAVELDFGMLMRSFSTTTSNYKLSINGKTTDGSNGVIADYTMTKNGNAATTASGKLSGASSTQSIVVDTTTVIPQETYLKFVFDTASKTFDAYYKQVALKSGTATNTLVKIGDNLPFKNASVAYLTNMTVLMSGEGSSDSFDPIEMKVSVLSDAECVAIEKEKLTIPSRAEGDIELPLASGCTSVTWSSSDEAVISSTGVITSATVDKTVTLTATVSCGDASDTKEFSVTVPRSYPVPTDGVWNDDEMDYSSMSQMPLFGSAEYGYKFENIIEGTDTTQAVGGVLEATGTSIKVLKGSDNTLPAAIYKYLAPSDYGNFAGKQVIEFAITPIGTPQIYCAIEKYDNWKGIITLNFNKGKWNAYTSPNSKDFTDKTKVTIVTDGANKTMSVYMNDGLIWKDIVYRDGWYDCFGKIQFSLDKAGTKPGDGYELDYIRTFQNWDAYEEFCQKTAEVSDKGVIQNADKENVGYYYTIDVKELNDSEAGLSINVETKSGAHAFTIGALPEIDAAVTLQYLIMANGYTDAPKVNSVYNGSNVYKLN